MHKALCHIAAPDCSRWALHRAPCSRLRRSPTATPYALVSSGSIEAGWHAGRAVLDARRCWMVKLDKPTKDGYDAGAELREERRSVFAAAAGSHCRCRPSSRRSPRSVWKRVPIDSGQLAHWPTGKLARRKRSLNSYALHLARFPVGQ